MSGIDRATSEQKECRYCHALRVVPVLDKRIERSPRAGNKYRTFCHNCGSWGPMTSEDHFRSSLHPHVLPADGDPNQPDSELVALENYDYGDEWADLREKVTADRAARARADGGVPLDEIDDPHSDEPDENEFNCPDCDHHVSGFPDECPNCGRGYNWSRVLQ